MSKSKNDLAWEKLFEKYNIIEQVSKNGSYQIRSKEINEFRESRLMTKFDHKSQLPSLFEKNNLSILPISRGEYVLSNIKTFHDFDNNDIEVERFPFPNHIKSINYNNITSEAAALNCAFVSGIIKDFSQEEEIQPTVSGRMSSLEFNFSIQKKDTELDASLNVVVKNSQLEIDGGYEGIESLCLIEAKNSISKDFLIRQLYYPYRLWSNKIEKKVRNLFLTYTNGVFHFREYVFDEDNQYNSIRLLRQKKYAIRGEAINMEILRKILTEVVIAKEPEIPFPQANSFERVINLCELLYQKSTLSGDEITENYDFDKRQTDYYTNAGKYLGLIEKVNDDGSIVFVLSSKGKKLFQLSIIDRQLEYVKLILSHLAFNKTLKLYFEKADKPTKEEIVAIMKTSNLYNIDSDKTFFRRSSTILRWINWILDLIEE